jgi:TPR repeat protein
MKLIFCLFLTCMLASAASDAPAAGSMNVADPALKRKLVALQMIWTDLEKEIPGSPSRKNFLGEFMAKSADYLNLIQTNHPTAGGVWTLRCVAACELNLEDEARKAGQAMLDRGLEKSDSIIAIRALALLERKGWIPKTDQSTPDNSALKLYQKFRETKVRADAGEAWAQCNVGLMYDNGHGVIKDETEAVRWYRKAADQGSVQAQFNLAVSYVFGTGVPKSDAEAIRWYLEAAMQGHAKALEQLMKMYQSGRGTGEYEKELALNYERLANQGSFNASYFVGMMYEFGRGVNKDIQEARRYYNRAAESGTVANIVSAGKAAVERLAK